MSKPLAAVLRQPSTLVFAIGSWLALIQISIAASQILLTLVLLLWGYQLALGKLELVRLPVDLPLAAFVTLSFASAVFSFDPLASLVDIKKLILFAIVYMMVSSIRREETLEQLVLLLIGVADLAALVSLWQYFFGELGDINHRLHGFMSHYMTFSGLLMEASILALGTVLFRRRGRRTLFLVASLGLILTVLLLSLTRSAWLGFLTATALLLLLKDRRLLLALPALLVGAWLLTPPEVATRLGTFLRPDLSGRDRYYMLEAGLGMSAHHPWLGVGPDMVSTVYPIYVAGSAPQRENVHLHNNMVQFAAERGLPCLAAWLWLVGSILYWSVRAFRAAGGDGVRRALAAGALGVVVAGLTAGFFEYNFGDSEFLMVFLFVSSIPFVLERNRQS